MALEIAGSIKISMKSVCVVFCFIMSRADLSTHLLEAGSNYMAAMVVVVIVMIWLEPNSSSTSRR